MIDYYTTKLSWEYLVQIFIYYICLTDKAKFIPKTTRKNNLLKVSFTLPFFHTSNLHQPFGYLFWDRNSRYSITVASTVLRRN